MKIWQFWHHVPLVAGGAQVPHPRKAYGIRREREASGTPPSEADRVRVARSGNLVIILNNHAISNCLIVRQRDRSHGGVMYFLKMSKFLIADQVGSQADRTREGA